MRKSFGGSGGGGGNGGDMLRNVGRVVRTRINNFQDPLPSSNNNKTSSNNNNTQKTSSANTKYTTSNHSSLTLSSPNTNTPVSAAWPPSPKYFVSPSPSNNGVDETFEAEGDDKWECFENYYDPIFGVAPSTHEVHHALYSLQQVLDPQSCSASCTEEKPCSEVDNMDEKTKSDASSTLPRASSKGSDTSDWLEPSMHPYDWKVTKSPGWGTVHDAFNLLQNEPTVQRMVVSLSSDKAVWDAVLNNEAVREIRDSYRDAAESFPPSSDEQLDPSKVDSGILKWIFENMKMKLLEALESISHIVGDTRKPLDYDDKEEQSYAFIEKLKSTFLVTIVVLLIVVVARGHMA